MFPELSRQAVLQGSQLLTSITNDAWFGRSSAPWQHLALARMRSVETGRYLARAANTGVSALVDPYGRVIQQTPLFEDAVAVGEVRFLDGTTPYVRIGDVVPWAGLVVALGLWGRACAAAPSRLRPLASCPRRQEIRVPSIDREEQLRRYEDLMKRSAAMRSYL